MTHAKKQVRRPGVFPGVTGWVYLALTSTKGVTVRWCRGQRVASVLRGRAVGEHNGDVLETFAVPATGWADLVEIETHGRAWLRTHHQEVS